MVVMIVDRSGALFLASPARRFYWMSSQCRNISEICHNSRRGGFVLFNKLRVSRQTANLDAWNITFESECALEAFFILECDEKLGTPMNACPTGLEINTG